MTRMLINVLIYLASAALGLWVASLLVDDVHLSASGFIITIVVFALAQWLLTPLIRKLTQKYANAFIGGVGLISTLVSLLVASLPSNGLKITGGVGPWILATLIVWLVTAIAALVLPRVFVKDRPEKVRS